MTTFDKAVRYDVTAKTLTPLRTGSADGSVDSVLRHRDGQAFLQASSLAGALHGWLARRNPAAAEMLFGSQERAGQLIVSDADFEQNAEMKIRPRLRINGKMGAADDGGKFDVAHIVRDTTLTFKLIWCGRQEDTEGPAQIEQMLAALDAGEICLGAQKTNGFGRVRLTVDRQVYRMTDKKDRDAWLHDKFNGKSLALPEIVSANVCKFTVEGIADSILVKGSVWQTESGEKICKNIWEKGMPILPGSSIKGAVRARVQMIADWLGCPKETVNELFGRGAADGDNSRTGQVRFEDAVLAESKTRRITRIRINKFTGGVMNGSLLKEEPRKSGVTLTITVPQDNARGCALMTYALRDLGLGLYNLGSGGAVGRGYINVSSITMEQNGEKACMKFNETGIELDDPTGMVTKWLHTLEEHT